MKRPPVSPGSRRPAIWRSDLVWALAASGEVGLLAVARTLGAVEGLQAPAPEVLATDLEASSEAGVAPVAEGDSEPFVPVPFWCVTEVYALDNTEVRLDAPPLTLENFQGRRRSPKPKTPPLVAWSRLLPHVQTFLRSTCPGPRIDEPKLVECWSKLEALRALPRRRSRLPAAAIVLIVDRSTHLEPFWQDQDEVIEALEHHVGSESLQVEWWLQGPLPLAEWEVPLPAGAPVLALTDLGAYSVGCQAQAWRKLAAELASKHVPMRAILPVPRDRWGPIPTREWSAIEWESPGRPGLGGKPEGTGDRAAQRIQLMDILAPALMVEVGLVRTIRRLVPKLGLDLGTEHEVWFQRNRSRGNEAAGFELDFSDWPPEAKAQLAEIVRSIRTWHECLPEEVWFEEALALARTEAGRACVTHEELERAYAFLERVTRNLVDGEPGADRLWKSLAGWTLGLVERNQDLRSDPRLGALLRTAMDAIEAEKGLGSSAVARPRIVWPRRGLGAMKGEQLEVPATIFQDAGRLVVRQSSPLAPIHPPASPLGHIRVGGELFLAYGENRWLPLSIATADGLRATRAIDLPQHERMWLGNEREEVVLRRIQSPTWAEAMTRDEYGLVAETSIKGVALRMRYIPPGRFMMGSPESEAGRLDREGPQHEVQITKGYWLAETPCTQALWEAVVGQNPSEFVSPDRPVEQVSWDDVDEHFLGALRKDSGSDWRLPTEAEWEYACRAGTQTSTYAGDLAITDEDVAEELDPIGWYMANCGEGFDLENGQTFELWPESSKSKPGGTRPVSQKAPNAWGLYDMLGNVWEWCSDPPIVYKDVLRTNPVGGGPDDEILEFYWTEEDPGASRVLRGGSWTNSARYLRAAYRDAYHPGFRFDNLGFRLARGQESAPGKGGGATREPKPGPRDAGHTGADGGAGRLDRAGRDAREGGRRG